MHAASLHWWYVKPIWTSVVSFSNYPFSWETLGWFSGNYLSDQCIKIGKECISYIWSCFSVFPLRDTFIGSREFWLNCNFCAVLMEWFELYSWFLCQEYFILVLGHIMASGHNGSAYSNSTNQMERRYSTKPEMCSVIRCT